MDSFSFSAFGPSSAPGSNATAASVVAAEFPFDFDQLGPTLYVYLGALQQIVANAGGAGIQLRSSTTPADIAGAILAQVTAPTGGTAGAMLAATTIVAVANPGGVRYLTFTSTGATGPTTLSFRGLEAALAAEEIDNCPVTATKTLVKLRIGAKVLADKVGDASVSDDSWTGFINDGLEDLWKRIVEATGDAFLATYDFALVGGLGGNTFDVTTIPARNFRRLRLLELDPTTANRRRIRPFNLAQKDDGSAGGRWGNYTSAPWDTARRYRRMGNLIYVERYEVAAGSYRLWYEPAITRLASQCDALPDVMDEWSEYPQVFAAMKALGIEESDPGVLAQRLAELRGDIMALKGPPDDDADTNTIADVEDEGGNRWD